MKYEYNVSSNQIYLIDEKIGVNLDETIEWYKAQRNSLLSASDWTQLPDASVDKQAWATYRQALRDLPQQPDFPNNITWPEPPK